MTDCLHRLHINGCDAASGVLHDDIEHPFTVGNSLFRYAAEIDGTEYGAVFGVDHGCILGGMTENVHPVVESIEVNAVGSCGSDIDGFDQFQSFGVKHRYWFAAGEAVAGLRIDRSAITTNARNLSDE